MRPPALVLAASLMLVTTATAVKLETSAQVTLITPLEANLDHWPDTAAPVWTVTGTPGEQLQLSLELRTASGDRLSLEPGEPATLDPGGRILTTLPAPASAPDPHAAAYVITLVVCRE